MFGRNVIPFAPIAPAEKIIEGATSNSTCDPFKLQQTGASFLTTVRVGDLIVKDPTTSPVSAYVLNVVSDTELILDEDLGFDTDSYDSYRPSVLPLRAPEGLEWVLRAVHADEGNDFFRVGLWFSDNSRTFLMLDNRRLYDREGGTQDDGTPYEDFTRQGFHLEGQNILVGHDHLIQVRNYTPHSLNIVVYGVNKTVDVPQG